MQENDIETELKNSADKITMKSFPERWDTIKDRVLKEETHQEGLAIDMVLVSPDGEAVYRVSNKRRKLLIFLLSLFFSCVLILAIVLPLTLRKKEMSFLNYNDLGKVNVSEEQFFKDINNVGYEVLDFSKFEIYSYIILTTDDSQVKGGIVQINNDDLGYFLEIAFYDNTVLLKEEDSDYEDYVVNTTHIKYLTKFDEEIFTTYAYANYKNLNYRIEYISLENNCTSIFEELFV